MPARRGAPRVGRRRRRGRWRCTARNSAQDPQFLRNYSDTPPPLQGRPTWAEERAARRARRPAGGAPGEVGRDGRDRTGAVAGTDAAAEADDAGKRRRRRRAPATRSHVSSSAEDEAAAGPEGGVVRADGSLVLDVCVCVWGREGDGGEAITVKPIVDVQPGGVSAPTPPPPNWEKRELPSTPARLYTEAEEDTAGDGSPEVTSSTSRHARARNSGRNSGAIRRNSPDSPPPLQCDGVQAGRLHDRLRRLDQLRQLIDRRRRRRRRSRRSRCPSRRTSGCSPAHVELHDYGSLKYSIAARRAGGEAKRLPPPRPPSTITSTSTSPPTSAAQPDKAAIEEARRRARHPRRSLAQGVRPRARTGSPSIHPSTRARPAREASSVGTEAVVHRPRLPPAGGEHRRRLSRGQRRACRAGRRARGEGKLGDPRQYSWKRPPDFLGDSYQVFVEASALGRLPGLARQLLVHVLARFSAFPHLIEKLYESRCGRTRRTAASPSAARASTARTR